MSSPNTLPVAIIIGGIIVSLAIYLSLNPGISAPKQGDPSLVRPVSTSDHILGNPDAKVFIIVYSDFDCEFCKEFHETLHEIIATEGTRGEIAWVFRQFPLSEIHPNALSHARAAECAAISGGNESFWKFADELFRSQPANPATYGAMAQTTGIPGDAFSACYVHAATTVDPRIIADRENAFTVGASGTPFSLIIKEGRSPIVVNGAYSYDALKEILEKRREN